MFSRTCEYGIRAMIFIAQHSKNGARVGIREIAAGIDSPEHFIAKIMQELGRKGVVQSVKGPNGGFYLDDKGRECTLAKIVRMLDGDQLFTGCGLGLRQCSEAHPCPIHEEFKKIRQEIGAMLENSRIGEFTAKLDEHQLFLKRK
ncbi:RrF2 family transcriptional regulator [Dinghuibacter silviterrae]|uniref:BadM/Rrf2 family transcriptional regulator n=1 Tax=Dinghuibacter silviterrae TaxID=1539049 RepID=A0A4R8DNM6_9BACT|nr:Rrf2 family transcriptional regulator [Dinghuibacter silviterrae]TDW99024.1 BadM/Rrf2 family transcriptional regulator [Dinghuibacter silviterrae]